MRERTHAQPPPRNAQAMSHSLNSSMHAMSGEGEGSPATATVSGGGERRRTAAAAPAAGPLRRTETESQHLRN